jgi:hypothetical protein
MTPAPKKANRFRSRGLAAAATTVGAVGVSQGASADIIYFEPSTGLSTSDIFLVDGTVFSGIELRFTSMGGKDNLSLRANDSAMMGSNSTVEFAYVDLGGEGFLDPLGSMTLVDSSFLTYADEAFLVRNDALHPTWSTSEDAYVGFRFQAGGTTTQYGWLHVTFDSENSLSIDVWAYEDEGQSILAGVTPEPGTALLLGCGLALLCGSQRRRWRRGTERLHG